MHRINDFTTDHGYFLAQPFAINYLQLSHHIPHTTTGSDIKYTIKIIYPTEKSITSKLSMVLYGNISFSPMQVMTK
jgi:hypothetical protein